MSELLAVIIKAAGLVFVLGGMAAAGMSLRVSEILRQLRRIRLMALIVTANFVAVPLLALVIARGIPIQPDHAAGLILTAGAAGAPLLPKLAQKSHASMPLAVTVMTLLIAGTVIFEPLGTPMLLPGLRSNALQIAAPLLLLILLPIALGVALNTCKPGVAARVGPLVARAADTAMWVYLTLVVVTNASLLLGVVGSGAILAAAVFAVAASVAGYAAAGFDPDARSVATIGTGQRNIAAAVVIAGSSFADRPGVLVMVLVTNLVGLVAVVPAVIAFRRSAHNRLSLVHPLSLEVPHG